MKPIGLDTTTFKIAINSMALDGKLPSGDPRWKRFNGEFVNRELSVIDFCNEVYTGHAYTTWHEGYRRADNFTLGQHIAIDMDTKDSRSSIATLQGHSLVKEFGAIIHITPSHTPQNPKARIIFVLDQPITTRKGYEAAVKTVHSLFPDADKAPTNAVSFFYGNSSANIDDIWFAENPRIPLDAIRAIYTKMKERQPEKQPEKHISHENTPPALEEVAVALKKIDPWTIDYKRWIGILAALKREFGDMALSVAVQWADGKPGEVEREWKKRLSDDHSTKMTTNTIFALAKGKIYA